MNTKDQMNTDYSKLTVASLKEILKARGLRVSGNKDELIGRLMGAVPEPVEMLPTASDDDKFFFYSDSKDMPPGKGTNEHVKDSGRYETLSGIPHWRRTLSNFHVADFVYAGHRWRTIEHVFQAAKINLVDPEKAFLFTVDSGSELGLGDGLAARKARKLVVLSPDALSQWDGIKDGVMEAASRARYSQDPHSREVLLATGDAQLWHIVSRSKPVRFSHLEKIRTEFRL